MLRRSLLTLVIALVLSPAVAADGIAAGKERSTIKRTTAPFMRTFGRADAPTGFQELCLRTPDVCRYGSGRERMALTDAGWNDLVEINSLVNGTVVAQSDLDVYGTAEYWVLPKTAGDCEDYALLKRKLLIDRGWTAGSLLMTVVKDEAGEGHAVLTARTTKGDFLLDNRREEILLWTEVPYTFVKRQSFLDPMAWMSLLARSETERSAVSSAPDKSWMTVSTR